MPGTTSLIQAGPGWLYAAPIGTAEPTSLTAALPSQWVNLGYTAEGSEFTHDINVDTIEVAEELDPVAYKDTGRSITLGFAMAELSAKNLQRALNGGTINTAAGVTTFEAPALNATSRVMLLWTDDDSSIAANAANAARTELWLFRRCYQTGSVTISRRKGADNATIPVTFQLEKPSGVQPYKVLFADPARTGT